MLDGTEKGNFKQVPSPVAISSGSGLLYSSPSLNTLVWQIMPVSLETVLLLTVNVPLFFFFSLKLMSLSIPVDNGSLCPMYCTAWIILNSALNFK